MDRVLFLEQKESREKPAEEAVLREFSGWKGNEGAFSWKLGCKAARNGENEKTEES